MKISKLLTAVALCAAIAPAAYAENTDIIRNGEEMTLDARIVDGRTMVNIDSLSPLGITVSYDDGVYSFEKGGRVLFYSERTEALTDESGETIELAVKPIMTSNERLIPLRETATELGIGVGWDEEARKAALIDLDAYFGTLKDENEALYNLLTLKFKNQTSGTSTGRVDFAAEIPTVNEYGELTDSVSLELKLSADGSVSDGVESSSMTLEKLTFDGADREFSLSDANFDAIYDVESETLYLKTNILERLAEEIDNGMLGAIAQNFTPDTWYKITAREFAGFICEYLIGSNEYGTDLYRTITSAYGDGLSVSDALRSTLFVSPILDDVNGYEYVQATIDAYRPMFSSGIMQLKSSGDKTEVVVDVNADTLTAMLADIYTDGFGLTEEEAEELRGDIKESLAGINLKITVSLDDGRAQSINMTADIDSDGVVFKGVAAATADFDAKAEKPDLPQESMELLPLLELIADSCLPASDADIGIIGGADGPTAIYIS